MRMFTYLIGDIYTNFISATVTNPELMLLICSTIDGTQLLDLMCQILQGNLLMFRKDSILAVLSKSLVIWIPLPICGWKLIFQPWICV